MEYRLDGVVLKIIADECIADSTKRILREHNFEVIEVDEILNIA